MAENYDAAAIEVLSGLEPTLRPVRLPARLINIETAMAPTAVPNVPIAPGRPLKRAEPVMCSATRPVTVTAAMNPVLATATPAKKAVVVRRR